VLEVAVTAPVGALPFEHSPLRGDMRDGHYSRDLDTSVSRIEGLEVPGTRRGYKTQLFERSARALRRWTAPQVRCSSGE
jgi:transposase-like protein